MTYAAGRVIHDADGLPQSAVDKFYSHNFVDLMGAALPAVIAGA